MDCPNCGNEVIRTISEPSMFTLDTIGTLGFCVLEDTIYIHAYEDIRDEKHDFESFNEASEKQY